MSLVGNAKGMFYYLEAIHTFTVVVVQAIPEIDLNAFTKQIGQRYLMVVLLMTTPLVLYHPKHFVLKCKPSSTPITPINCWINGQNWLYHILVSCPYLLVLDKQASGETRFCFGSEFVAVKQCCEFIRD